MRREARRRRMGERGRIMGVVWNNPRAGRQEIGGV